MEPKTTKKPSRKLVVFKRELPFYLMLIPGVTFLIIFSYLPMFGLVMAFQDFTPLRSFKNSPWVGLKNFRDMLALPTFWNVVGNTLSISIAKIILRLLVPLILALLLNEVVRPKFMRMAQTVFFLPYFLSWAVMGGVLRNLFQYDGMVNELLGRIGIDPMRALNKVYTKVPMVIMARQIDCTTPTVLGLGNMPAMVLNSCLPTTPPTAAPMASGVPVRKSTRLSPAAMFLPTV